jgi:hypothetical protein
MYQSLLEKYRLVLEKRFVCPSDSKSYTDVNVSSWLSHPCQIGQRVGAIPSVTPGPPGLSLDVRLTRPPRNNLLLRKYGGVQDPQRAVAPVKKKYELHRVSFIISLMVEGEPVSGRLYSFNQNGVPGNVQDMHHFKTHLRQKLLNLNISSYHFILF